MSRLDLAMWTRYTYNISYTITHRTIAYTAYSHTVLIYMNTIRRYTCMTIGTQWFFVPNIIFLAKRNMMTLLSWHTAACLLLFHKGCSINTKKRNTKNKVKIQKRKPITFISKRSKTLYRLLVWYLSVVIFSYFIFLHNSMAN